MDKKLIDKLSEDMAYAILENSEVNNIIDGILNFSTCVNLEMEVTSGDPVHLKTPNGEFDIDLQARSNFEVLAEAFAKTYYIPLLNNQ